ncbi:alpha-(1-_3)-arabinofuranosyltransferase domain-containing protein [Nocardioides dongxiaopingii]|uniref:alpha-(1->3)-arabinofuranosyltransferase domain-containing protein n=1 Tax=Nocardioides dongxiaopingii TaxID=2576036 RepID=UPI0014857126|nr:alpha-(1->3)-arabinofuranosyltransferase family protein [Nocardioides dongxiaopingii]
MPLTWLWFMLMAFLQRQGATTFDTKFDLTADPGRFMARSLSLWNQNSSFGELQNQAYGYLFPQGTFFLVGDWIGLPDWVVQRLWSGLLLVVAFEGCRRLFAAMRPDASPWAAWFGGVAFAVAPRLLGLAGVLSAEVLPTAVLPWVVLPIVLAQQGRLGPRAGALWSGVAILFLGGVNAVENLAALPLPLLVVLATVRRPGGARLARWWAGATVLASAWWMLPLLVLGRFSPPFLDYIETSIAVVRPLGWTNVTRGADHWLSFVYVGGQPWWPGAYTISTAPVLVAVTAVVSALGFLGLTRRDMPLRTPLLASLLLGAVCLTISRGGALASPLHAEFQFLLDGPFSMLRNVHKVDPLLRLPLALGLAHAATWMVPATGRSRAALRTVATTGVVLLLLVAAHPLWNSDMRKPGWTEVPDAWQEATDYLADVDGTGSALVLPGSGFGQQWWGWTIDEPIQGLATTPWATRSQVPLTPGSTIRFLDAIQERVADGQGSPALADVLARAGVEYVVVRRDLDLYASGAPDPARVDLALRRSPGLSEVASFGSSGFGEQPMISILAVDRDAPRVEAVDASGIETLAGGPEDVITAIEAGVLDPGTPVVVEGETNWDAVSPGIVGDGYRKRERAFGRLEDAVGQVMTSGEEYRTARTANDYPGPEASERVAASYDGIASVVASSSGGYSDTFGPVRPELGPYAAVDGLDTTFWQSSPLLDPVGQWVEVRFDEPVTFPRLTLTLGVDGVTGVPVREVRVTAGDEVVTRPVDPEVGIVEVPLRGSYDSVRVEVTRTAGAEGVVAIRDISFPGLDVERTLVVPDEGADADSAFVFRSRPHRRGCIDEGLGTSCGFLSNARPSEEESGMVRRITLGEAGAWDFGGAVVARATTAGQRLMEPILEKTRVRASTTYLNEPGVGPQMAFDADPRTFWAAAKGDPRPTLRLRWGPRRTIDSITVTAPAGTAVAPTGALVSGGSGPAQQVTFDVAGRADLDPITSRRLRIRLDPAPADVDAPLGVAELGIGGLDDQRYRLDRDLPTGSICGIGPELEIDGETYPTTVVGTLGQVIDGTPMPLASCDGPIELDAGAHDVRITATEQFAASELTLRPAEATTTAAPARRDVDVRSWTSNARSVEVGPGAEALLLVPENVNDGWVAELDGERLDAVRVDGWKQGYVLPEGDGGRVTLTYGPNRLYQAALALGGLLALLLVAGAVVATRREDRGVTSWPDPARAVPPWPLVWRVVGVVVAVLVGGPALGLGFLVGVVGSRRLVDPPAVGAALIGLAGLAAGVVAIGTPGLPPGACDAVAGFGMGLVGAALAIGALVRAPADDKEDADV